MQSFCYVGVPKFFEKQIPAYNLLGKGTTYEIAENFRKQVQSWTKTKIQNLHFSRNKYGLYLVTSRVTDPGVTKISIVFVKFPHMNLQVLSEHETCAY